MASRNTGRELALPSQMGRFRGDRDQEDTYMEKKDRAGRITHTMKKRVVTENKYFEDGGMVMHRSEHIKEVFNPSGSSSRSAITSGRDRSPISRRDASQSPPRYGNRSRSPQRSPSPYSPGSDYSPESRHSHHTLHPSHNPDNHYASNYKTQGSKRSHYYR